MYKCRGESLIPWITSRNKRSISKLHAIPRGLTDPLGDKFTAL